MGVRRPDRRRAGEHEAGQGHQHEPGRLRRCDQSIQEAIDDALAQGAVVVVAAGNASANVADFSPANCSGVITVGAHTQDASLTSYSNFGPRIDVSAPGGDLPVSDLIVSTSNDGTTVPAEPDYEAAAGTSFAAPLVSGTAALMLARNPMLTAGRVLDLMTGTAREFPLGSICAGVPFCGSGLLDAGAALASTLPGGSTPPPGAFGVVEYYRADLDHYFITAEPAEIAYIDTVLRALPAHRPVFLRVPVAALRAVRLAAGVPVLCDAASSIRISSRRARRNACSCSRTGRASGLSKRRHPFYIQVPDANGNCPADTLPVYRFFNNRNDANHRYTVDLSVRRAMLNRGWVPEGNGKDAVAFCSVF